MKLLKIAAAAIVLVGTGAVAQMDHQMDHQGPPPAEQHNMVTTHHTVTTTHRMMMHGHGRRVCTTHWRHHQRMRSCHWMH